MFACGIDMLFTKKNPVVAKTIIGNEQVGTCSCMVKGSIRASGLTNGAWQSIFIRHFGK
jgi:hypothetical protein